MTLQPVLKPLTRRGFAASPIYIATALESQRLETRHVGASKRAFRARLPQISFVRGFRRFSSRVTKCHPFHGICTLSPLRAALTTRFAKDKEHDTSKVLGLPRKMTSEVFKVLHLPRKCNASSENVAKVLRLLHKTTFDTS